MAGIYLHIPFCKQACHYCDFHFSTNLKQKERMVRALVQEARLQEDYLKGETVHSIYFGGGTPSLLKGSEIDDLLDILSAHYSLASTPEITLEANPDDLSRAKLKELRASGINRLSIGIQSFHAQHLRFMNRAHNATQARNCVPMAREAGFENISIDLIYAVPASGMLRTHGSNPEAENSDAKNPEAENVEAENAKAAEAGHALWQEDLQEALRLKPEHISSYCLTIEPQTAFGNWLKKGKLKPVDDEYAAQQFEQLQERLQEAAYEQYEISNFCLKGAYSRHNSSYWQQQNYLGLGPSAHSFNGTSRQYNLANNGRYLKAIEANNLPFEREKLSRTNMINEYLLTGLRTKWGCKLSYLKEKHHYDLQAEHNALLQELIRQKYVLLQEDTLMLSNAGKLLADEIAAKLMTED